MVSTPIGTEHMLEHAVGVVRDGGVGHLACCLADILDKKTTALSATASLWQRKSYLERFGTRGYPSKHARRAYGNIRELPGSMGAKSLVQEGCPGYWLTLQPHQQAQAGLPMGVRGLGMASKKARRECFLSIGCRVGIFPKILTNLAGPSRHRGKSELNIIDQLEGSLREIQDTCMGTTEAMAGIVPEPWQEWGHGTEGNPITNPPEADIL